MPRRKRPRRRPRETFPQRVGAAVASLEDVHYRVEQVTKHPDFKVIMHDVGQQRVRNLLKKIDDGLTFMNDLDDQLLMFE